MGYLEDYGNWNDEAKYVQITKRLRRYASSGSSELEIIGNPKVVLQQMIDCVKQSGALIKEREEWLEMIETGRKQHVEKITKQRVELVYHNKLLYPDAVGYKLGKFVDEVIPEGSVIFDSYTGNNYFTDKLTARFAGQILDSAEWAGVGHGVGMAIGAPRWPALTSLSSPISATAVSGLGAWTSKPRPGMIYPLSLSCKTTGYGLPANRPSGTVPTGKPLVPKTTTGVTTTRA